MTNPWVVLVATVLLIALSALFVVIEFSLLGARRHRLEEAAVDSRSARAALRGSNELTIMLAGAQLGITAATFALGAVTKPAIDGWFGPVFSSWGMPAWSADVLAFVLSLLIVTFLHLVVGEMAPKSWAIAHPEASAIMTALPARAFIWVFRPLLVWINRVANRLVAATGVEPVDRAAVGGHDAATIRHLVEHSANVGALDASFRSSIAKAIELETLLLRDVVPVGGTPSAVAGDATAGDVHREAARSGHLRILVGDVERARAASGASSLAIVHVRDTLLEPAERPARELARPAFMLSADTPVHDALARMRHDSEQLAVVSDEGRFVGVVTLDDVLRNVLPRPEDPAAAMTR
ncbi:hemolysin family protein [Microbacterium sp. LRZ72]|uniref:hemolysin family protein n=1 Tax=Microbacterium sp. LRZ72 TaxID=2942481 RepID=UPI0029B544D6|nr:hemolysin family protein [Microbacterium sp. LRZ72]MDX2377106.1 hemolysin family protein [Microbacterium sp. LRZ72]